MVCLASSLKRGGLCIAGRELTDSGLGSWIRPVSVRPDAELTYLEYRYESGQSPKVLDVLDVPVLKPDGRGHQVENVLIDRSRRWMEQGRLPYAQVGRLVDQPASLWTNSESSAHGRFNCMSSEAASRFGWSLCLIRVDELWIESACAGRGDKVFRASFEYRGVSYKLSVTDPVVREQLDARPTGKYRIGSTEIFLCVSLSEAFRGDGRCHKLVASVIAGGEFEVS